jgi:hypothetical protein
MIEELVTSDRLPRTIQTAVIPVFLELPVDVVEQRVEEFSDLASEPAGIAGTRLATVDSPFMQTEDVFAVAIQSKKEQNCTCCSNPIQPGVVHTLFAFPPQNTTPYRHVDQSCFMGVVIPNLVTVRRVDRITAYQGIRKYTRVAQKIKNSKTKGQ